MTGGWFAGLDRPDSKQLTETLRSAIRDGSPAAGTRVPSTRSLAQELGIARGTVTRAYEQLAAEGFLIARQGAPTVVAELPPAPAPASPHATDPEPEAGRWDFRPGRPNLSAFPRRDWLAASRRALRDAPTDDLGYGDPQGHPRLREALAGYLARERAVATTPANIIVCNGYTQALSLLSNTLADQGETSVDFEDPSAPHLWDIPAGFGMAVHGIPVDSEGLDVSRLRSRAVVVTPAHQFPLGVSMSSARRTELVRRAKDEDLLVIDDDYDGEFRFDRQPVGSLQGMAPDNVVYAGTASKTLAPALRLAWLALPSRLVEPVRELKRTSGLHAPLFEQLAMAELILSGAYDQHVRRSRATYRQRREQLGEALRGMRANHRPHPAGISAGLHVTLQLDPEGPTESEVLDGARRHSVELQVLGPHWVAPGEHPPGVIVGYAAPSDHAFRPALRALVTVLER
ncbi:PLP-dependent aminotransferase family protein [Saccharopolyspora flava]|uniref:Transcriptional regulator, GntR family n=1 Tax=Saccharopolyspora flava TaxID=95161 RepID=A0A1I6PWK4_9PSEU|nr:PLP-dependent aminotransferase family protein [Saccharopolyspora flava]SFS44460.1 transcriptional regulator, GntR family [Saccharopolyspora flava]